MPEEEAREVQPLHFYGPNESPIDAGKDFRPRVPAVGEDQPSEATKSSIQDPSVSPIPEKKSAPEIKPELVPDPLLEPPDTVKTAKTELSALTNRTPESSPPDLQ